MNLWPLTFQSILLSGDLNFFSVIPEVIVDVEPAARLGVADVDEQRQHLRPLLGGLHGFLHDGLGNDDWQKVRPLVQIMAIAIWIATLIL